MNIGAELGTVDFLNHGCKVDEVRVAFTVGPIVVTIKIQGPLNNRRLCCGR